MSDAMLTAARKLGGYAGRTGHPITACPYDPGSKHAIERAAARAYVSEWLRARPGAQLPDYDDDDQEVTSGS